MASPIKSFGSPKKTDNIQDLYAEWHVDNLRGGELQNASEMMLLNSWIKDNVLHALESCPWVLSYWKMKYPAQADRTLCLYAAAALESLDDNVKIDILLGNGKGRAQADLFYYLNQQASNWTILSPAWIGPVGSDLRTAAVQKGWCDLRLSGQVPHSISRPEALQWSQWVPFAHSIAVSQRGGLVNLERRNPNGKSLAPIETTGQAWALPEDMALAQSLLKHMAHYLYTLIPHPDAETISDGLQKRMDAFVGLHAGLDMMPALNKMIRAGQLHEHGNEVLLALPALGELSI